MDAAALAGRIEAIEDRLAGTDAERRAALMCAKELRAAGRRPRTQTLWFRRGRMLPRALQAAVGVVGSIVAASHPVVGLALAGGALLVAVLEAAGVPVIGLLSARRATQNVVAPAPGQARDGVKLVLVAAVDAPRDSVLDSLERRMRARLPVRGVAALVPGALGLHLFSLAAVAACAGARVAGAEGVALGAAQLVPSTILILLIGAFIEAGTTGPVDPAPAAGPAVALAIGAALDARPPRHVDVEVLIAGARHAGAAGMRAYVRSLRRTIAAEDIVVLELGSAAGPVRVLVRDGELFGARLHPRLAELALEAAGPQAAAQGRALSAARVARGARWPALALQGDARPLAELVLRLVAKIDAEVGARSHADE